MPTVRPLPPSHALIQVYEPKNEYKYSSLSVRTSPNKQLLSPIVRSVWLKAGGEPDQTHSSGVLRHTDRLTERLASSKTGKQNTLKLKCISVALLLRLHRRPPSPPYSTTKLACVKSVIYIQVSWPDGQTGALLRFSLLTWSGKTSQVASIKVMLIKQQPNRQAMHENECNSFIIIGRRCLRPTLLCICLYRETSPPRPPTR